MKQLLLARLSIISHSILRQLVPNVGSVLIMALMFFAYRAQAFSQGSVSNIPAAGAAPGVISYQGTLSDADGNPVDGNVDIVFKLFDAPTDGTLKWTETYSGANAVIVKNGVFHVLFGSITAFQPSDWSTYPLYLEIKVGSDAPMTPREMISNVPLAMNLPDGAINSQNTHLNVGEIQAVIPDHKLVLTATPTDVPGTAATIVYSVPQKYLVNVVADLEVSQGLALAQLYIDNVPQNAQLILDTSAAHGRATVSQTYLVDLSAGSHTFVIKARFASGSANIYDTHTKYTYLAVAP